MKPIEIIDKEIEQLKRYNDIHCCTKRSKVVLKIVKNQLIQNAKKEKKKLEDEAKEYGNPICIGRAEVEAKIQQLKEDWGL